MSVNVGQRVVKNTESVERCDAVFACKKLMDHTMLISKNPNIFLPEAQGLTISVQMHAASILALAAEANNTMVKTGKNWETRCKLQEEAIQKLKSFPVLMDSCRSTFHLRKNKFEYWVFMNTNATALVIKWHEADVKRYSYLLDN